MKQKLCLKAKRDVRADKGNFHPSSGLSGNVPAYIG